MNKENIMMNIMDYPKKLKVKQYDDSMGMKNIPKKIFTQSNQPQAITFSTIPVLSLKITNKQKDLNLFESNQPVDSKSNTKSSQTKIKFTENCLKTATTDHFNKLIEQEKELISNINSILIQKKAINEEIDKASVINNTLIQEQLILRDQLEQIKIITEQKQQASLLNISNLSEIKNQLHQQYDRSSKIIESIQKKRQLLTETTINKNNQIHLANNEYNILSEKELDIVSIEKTLSENISHTDIEIKKAEKKQYELHLEVNRLQDKKLNHDKSRLDTLSHILTLKPYYKKFLIFRNRTSIDTNIIHLNYNNNNKNNINANHFIIHKNRKNLQLNEATQYKYDYIISAISNPYEENSINEGEYINNELVNIILPYITQFNQGNEHKNCFVLHISQISYRGFNETLMTLMNNVLVRYPEYSLNIRLQLKNVMLTLNKDIELEKQIDNVKEFPSAFVYELKDEKNLTRIWLCNVGFDNAEMSSILFKLNELNQTKIQKKKMKNTNNNNNNKDNVNNLMKEINELNPFYSLGIIDINVDEVNLHYVQNVMNEL